MNNNTIKTVLGVLLGNAVLAFVVVAFVTITQINEVRGCGFTLERKEK